MTGRTIFSFIVDDDPIFAYEGWHLARSLIAHCGGDPSTIVVQCTPEVSTGQRKIFSNLGCRVQQVARFGDGRHCNKINQINNLDDFDCAVLLDTDTIAVGDLRPFLNYRSIQGKVVDAPNPPLAILADVAAMSKLSHLPAVIETDNRAGDTYVGNCNGGFYSVPKVCAEKLSQGWQKWAHWLFDHIEPLQRSGHTKHVDQVSFWLAVQHMGLPFESAPSNVNYYVHMEGEHGYFDRKRPLVLLHYHSSGLESLGHIVGKPDINPVCAKAVAIANQQISEGFDNQVFWDWRYRHFPERGSGIGSREGNLVYKRRLLIEQGVESVSSVLDVGCGDLEVVKGLKISHYIGIDQSAEAIDIARCTRPDWQFRHGSAADAPTADMVLCFEVLIHQERWEAYDELIAMLAIKTRGSLLVSGYATDDESIRQNPMIFFHEPLAASLRRTGCFKSVREIGRHTDVVVYRCDV